MELQSAQPAADIPAADPRLVPARARRRPFLGVSAALLCRPLGLLGLAGLLIGLAMPPTGIGPSYCGMQRSMGVPCPGCGLTRSVSSVLHGQIAWAYHYHPFGLAFVAGMLVLGVGALLPTRWRNPVIERLGRYDNVLGWLFLIFCAGLLLFGIYRIAMVMQGNPDYIWWQQNGETPPPWVQ